MAHPYTAGGKAANQEGESSRRLPDVRARLSFPYRSPFHRTVRLIGMATLLGSSLGLLAGVAGLPVNPFSMLGALLLSMVLIGFTLRPSLRKPKF